MAATNTDEDSSPDYRREAEILSTINHPNVVTLHSVAHSPTTLFLLMEPAAGDLRAHVAALPGGVCSEPEARRLFSSLLSAVSHLHDRSIVHRDIKLSNVLLSAETGDVLLADFGLAAFFGEPRLSFILDWRGAALLGVLAACDGGTAWPCSSRCRLLSLPCRSFRSCRQRQRIFFSCSWKPTMCTSFSPG